MNALGEKTFNGGKEIYNIPLKNSSFVFQTFANS